jgi:hypothetical protein
MDDYKTPRSKPVSIMGYKKLSNLVAQLLALLKEGHYNGLSARDKQNLLNDIESELF